MTTYNPDRKDYFRLYMRAYRERQADAEGRVLRKYRGRPRKQLQIMPAIVECPGWPTREQLMAGR